MRFAALTSRIEADLARGMHDECVPALQTLVAQQPLREGLREMLMRALYRSDRQAEALAVYDAGRRILRDELGVEPSPALREVHRRVLTQTEPSAPTTRGARSPRPRLPSLLDETVGRAGDLEVIEELLTTERTRLVSVLGPGGVGKTRLSIELAHRISDRYRDGVVFVPLAEAQTSADVAAIICSALGVPAADEAEESLLRERKSRQMLLICDNFEHVTEASGLLARLLGAAPGIHILATSRRTLGLRGEQQHQLEPLTNPSEHDASPAVHLFVARARSSDARFNPSERERADISKICGLCDGLPLAIELAAARTHALSVPELLARLTNPLPLLSSTGADRPPRQQTLRASIAWSVDGLPQQVQRVLAQLTVFRGGFTLAGAAAIAGLEDVETLHCIETLLDHSLLRRTRGSHGGHRFGLLETIRQYAAELITAEQTNAAQHRHATFYRALLNPAPDPTPTPSTASEWIAQLAERPNIRAAIRWALDSSDGELTSDLVIGAVSMWTSVGPRDARQLGRNAPLPL